MPANRTAAWPHAASAWAVARSDAATHTETRTRAELRVVVTRVTVAPLPGWLRAAFVGWLAFVSWLVLNSLWLLWRAWT